MIINAKIEKVNFNKGDFYLVDLKPQKGERMYYVAGISVNKLNKGDFYEFELAQGLNAKYPKGWGFKSIKKAEPKDNNGVKLLLESIKGIGDKAAKKILDYFNDNKLDLISTLKERPESIKLVKLSDKQYESIINFFNDYKENTSLQYLQSLGFDYEPSMKIVNKMKENKIKNIEEAICNNPYILLFYSILKFEDIDKIALTKFNLHKRDERRVEQCLYYVLALKQLEGNTCFPINETLSLMSGYLNLSMNEIRNELTNIEMQKEIFYIEYNGFYYTKRNYAYESGLAYKLNQINNNINKKVSESIILKYIKEFEINNNITLNEEQKEAIVNAVNNNITIITGGAGVGKSTIQGCLIYVLKNIKCSFKLLAPTGKAANVLAGTTNEICKTIHRGLEYKFTDGSVQFAKDKDNPFEEEYIVVDESSMIDIYIMYDLLQAIDNSRLIVIGDPGQLPSVKCGNILTDMVKSLQFKHTHLNRIYRQGAESLIIENARRVRQGLPVLKSNEGTNYKNDFLFIQTNNKEETEETILDLVKHRITSKHNIDKEDIQVLTPKKKDTFGCFSLNKKIQEIVNKGKKKVYESGETKYKIDDKIIQIRNNYEIDIFNGESGKIIDVTDEEIEIEINETKHKYKHNEIRENILHSYALTIHKSQGSQYKAVIIPIVREDYMMLYNNLLYTGITRGSDLVILVGDYNLIKNMKVKEIIRHSNLAKMIKGA